MNNSGDTLNFLDLVLNEYLNPKNSRELLEKYFYREFRKAEKEFYDAEEFFKGCLGITESLHSNLEYQLLKQKEELYSMRRTAENKTLNFVPDNRNISYEERCKETLEYCDSELNNIELNNLPLSLSSLSKGKYPGQLYYKEVLFIENKIIEAYQKYIDEQAMDNNSLSANDIDFSRTEPEYFLNKENELQDKFRVQIVVNRTFIEDLGEMGKGHKVGDIASKYPDWPENKTDAFELFKNLHAQELFLNIIANFLNEFHSWNEKAIKDELAKINEFIESANRIDLREAIDKRFLAVSDEKIYLRLVNDYYLHKSNIEYDAPKAKFVYAKYVLFKELLEKKKETSSDNDKKTENVKSIKGLTNNFDNNDIEIIYKHFYKLVEKKYLSENDLILFIELAFEKRKEPVKKFKLENVTSKQKIIKIFYYYFKNICQKPHGKQKLYASLLSEYFEGYSTENVSTNFSK